MNIKLKDYLHVLFGFVLLNFIISCDAGTAIIEGEIDLPLKDIPLDFTDIVELPDSNLIRSEIIYITDIKDAPSSIEVTGSGSPRYRICADKDCSTVVTDWTDAANINPINNGQFIQLEVSTITLLDVVSVIITSIGDTSLEWNITIDNSVPIVAALDCDLAVNEDANYVCTNQPIVTDLDGPGPNFWSLDPANTCSWINIDSASGVLTGAPENNAVGTCTLAVIVNDGLRNSIVKTLDIVIANVAPTLTIGDITILEDSVNTGMTPLKSDLEVQADDESSNNGGGYTILTSGVTSGTPCIDNKISLNIDATSGVITYEPALEYSGTCNIKIEFNDGNAGGIVATEFAVTVTPVNDPPTIISFTCNDTVNTLNQDVAFACSVAPGATDPDGPGAFNWDLAGSNTCAWISVNASSGALTGTPNDDNVGDCTIALFVSDGMDDSEITLHNVTVNNLAPTLTIAGTNVPEDSTSNTPIHLDAAVEANEEIYGSYSLLTPASSPACNDNKLGDLASSLTIDTATGAIVYKPKTGYTTTCYINVQFDDGNTGGTVASEFAVTIMTPNVAPTLDSIVCHDDSGNTLDQGDSFSCSTAPAYTDADGPGPYTWSLDATNGCDWISIDGSTGALSGDPTNDNIGTCTIAYKVSDNLLLSSVKNHTVTVNNVAPTLSIADVTIYKNPKRSINLRTDSQVQASEEGSGAYSFDHATTTGTKCSDHQITLTIDPSTGNILYEPETDYSGDCNLKVKFDDGNSGVITSQFIVHIDTLPSLGVANTGYHSCVLTEWGEVMCSGNNLNGELGDGSYSPKNEFGTVVGLDSGVVSISNSLQIGCAILDTGVTKCWGDNAQGQLADGNSPNDSNVPVTVNGLSSTPVAIASGFGHSCALLDTGGLQCWGLNSSGQVGDSSLSQRILPVDVTGLTSGVKFVASGEHHSCAILDSGAVKCWGANNWGQIGDGTTVRQSTPRDVDFSNLAVKSISLGAVHTCAVLENGSVSCWGRNLRGQLGIGNNSNRSIPANVPLLNNDVTKISSGDTHTCALLANQSVKCWGENATFELGDGTDTERTSPVLVAGLGLDNIEISVGNNNSCVLLDDGEIKCWGSNWGAFGDGTNNVATSPVSAKDIRLINYPLSISTGEIHTCSLWAAGGVKCWGRNAFSQLANSSAGLYPTTIVDAVNMDTNIESLYSGAYMNCIILTTGALKCWGRNSQGVLGDGTSIERDIPVAVLNISNDISSVSIGSAHVCLVTDGGAAKCWGGNTYGVLGDNTDTVRMTPTDVSGLSNGVAVVRAGFQHSCAVMTSGDLKCWGRNHQNQLGIGAGSNSFVPITATTVSGDTVIDVGVGNGSTCALLDTGSVKCWGRNSSGDLGDGTGTSSSNAVFVAGLSGLVTKFSPSYYGSTCVILNTGGVQCWGYNPNGEVGNGTNSNAFSAVDATALTSGVIAIGSAAAHSCAILSNKEIKCWGDNNGRQIGDGLTSDSWVPKTVVIP